MSPGAALGAGAAVADFVDALVTASDGRVDGPEGTVAAGVKVCMAGALSADERLVLDGTGRGREQSREAYVADAVMRRHQSLRQPLACLVATGLVSDDVMAEFGGRLLFIAISLFGTTPEPFAFMDAVMARGPNLAYTLKASAQASRHGATPTDGFNVLHKAVDRHKFVLMDAARQLLIEEEAADDTTAPDEITANRAAAFIASFADNFDGVLAPEHIPAARAAASRLTHSLVTMTVGGASGARVTLGRTVSAGDVDTLNGAVTYAVVAHLLAMLPAVPRPRAAPHVPQPSVLALLTQRDMYGRTPLHVAVSSSPITVPLLLAALDAVRNNTAAPPADAAAAALAPFMLDAFGYSPRMLALAKGAGHEAAADAATAAEVRAAPAAVAEYVRQGYPVPHIPAEEDLGGVPVAVVQARMLARMATWTPGRPAEPLRRAFTPPPPPPPSQPLASSAAHAAGGERHRNRPHNDGGWVTPRNPSPHATAAVDAVHAQLGRVNRCDIDVLEAAHMPVEDLLERFVYDYLIPGRPVAMRGAALTNPLRHYWGAAELLERHGDMAFAVSDIPYVRVVGWVAGVGSDSGRGKHAKNTEWWQRWHGA